MSFEIKMLIAWFVGIGGIMIPMILASHFWK